MLIRNAEVEGDLHDVRLAGGRIAEVASTIVPREGECIIGAKGGALLPGLHDHHIHLQATAAALQSVKCGPPEVASLEELAEALHSATGDGWLRGVGYHDSIGVIDRDWLDRHGPDRPVRIQHRGGRMWVLNTRAIDVLGIDAPADGRLIDRDHELRSLLQTQRPDLSRVTHQLVSRGVTGVTDTSPGNGKEDFAFLAESVSSLRLIAMGTRDLDQVDPIRTAKVGALKLHYHDHDLPALDDLAAEIAGAHDAGRNAAMHCVTRAEIMLALAAFEQAGAEPGDRLEHAAVADRDIVDWIARLGLTVVTQPHFVRERGDTYMREVEAEELPHLWPLRRFRTAGIGIAGGSDAPFGKLDPWSAMDAATQRPDGLSQEEAVSPEEALALYTKPADDAGAKPRKVAAGETADLCLIDRSWGDARTALGQVKVVATWIGGDLAYETISSTSPQSSAV